MLSYYPAAQNKNDNHKFKIALRLITNWNVVANYIWWHFSCKTGFMSENNPNVAGVSSVLMLVADILVIATYSLINAVN